MPSLFANWGSRLLVLSRPPDSSPSTAPATPEPTPEPNSAASSSSVLSNVSFPGALPAATAIFSSPSPQHQTPPVHSLPLPPPPPQPFPHLQTPERRTTTTAPTASSSTGHAHPTSRLSSISSSSFSSSLPPDRPAPPPPRPAITYSVLSSPSPFATSAERGLLSSSWSSPESSPSTSASAPVHSSASSSSSSQRLPTSEPAVTDTRAIVNRFLPLKGAKNNPKQGPHPPLHTALELPTDSPRARPPISPSHSSHSSHSFIRVSPHSIAHFHPHSTSQPTRTPIVQTVTTSALSSFSSSSLKGSLKGSLKDSLRNNNLFNIKRYRRQRQPLPFSSSAATTGDLDLDLQFRALQSHRRLSKDTLSPHHPSRMQQVEYMTDSQQGFPLQIYEGSTRSCNMASVPTPSPAPATQRQTLSSKRMRPPLAEISTATAAAVGGINNKLFQSNIFPNNNSKSNTNGNNNRSADGDGVHLHDTNFISCGFPPLPHSAVQPSSEGHQQQLQRQQHHDADHRHDSQHVNSTATRLAARRLNSKRTVSRGHLSREVKAIKNRIRKLWMDPRQPEHHRSRHDPKNQYLLLEESLTSILQIVPPIIQNARAPSSGLDLTHPAATAITDQNLFHAPAPVASISVNRAESSTGSTTALPSSPPPWSGSSVSPPANASNAPSKSSESTPSTPIRTRARTTSSNSASTMSATRYQIATSILQPPEPALTDIAQSAIRSPTNATLLGEPALSTIAASASSPQSSNTLHKSSSEPRLAESNEILIKRLFELSNTFKGAIRTLCEQQNEKVLRFDDDMILDLLTRWEQEAGKGELEQEPENSSTTSLVTLGATNALERYQITVGRVWEETEMILSGIRKIRDLVEFGRVQHFSDFDDDDSEEDAVERGDEIKRNLYSTLLFHANGLVTVLGEFLECVSGIQRLVGTIKTQRRKSQDVDREDPNLSNALANEFGPSGSNAMVDFMTEEPRPIKHLNPALMRKLKPKTPFKSITDKVRRSFTDFAKQIFPPLGDGSNEGFHTDSYSDGEYEPEEFYAATEMGSSIFGDDEAYLRTLSPPESPGLMSDKHRHRHRRLSSRDSSGLPEQYWPGSMRLGLSDDSLSPTNPVSPSSTLTPSIPGFGAQSMAMSRSMSSERTVDTISTRFRVGAPGTPPVPRKSLESLRESAEPTSYFSYEPEAHSSPVSPVKSEGKEKRQSILFLRRNSQTPTTFTGASISAPIPTASRPFSVHSSGSESQTLSRHNYRARPPKPPGSLPPMPPSPSHSYFKAEEIMHESSPGQQQSRLPNSRMTSYLATRTTSPQPVAPLMLDSPFNRQTSIRMVHDRNRYSIKMPSDDVAPESIPTSRGAASTSSSIRSYPSAFWRRRSYNDALEKSWQALQLQDPFQSGASETSAQSTPVASEFATGFPGPTGQDSRRTSVRMTSFEFLVPFFSKENAKTMATTSASRPVSDSSTSSSRPWSDRYYNRRHSSPLTLGAEKALADALSRRTSVSSQKSQQSASQASVSPESSANRNSVHMMPTVDEDSNMQIQKRRLQQLQHAPRHSRSTDQLTSFVEADCLSIPTRPRLYPKACSYESTRQIQGRNPENGPLARDHRDSHQHQHQQQQQHEQLQFYQPPGASEGQRVPEVITRPSSVPKLGDNRKAWELLNLDYKRINQYSHWRAYARNYTGQNNLWALSHPNALQSTTSPKILHICENGVDVLVLEMFPGYLQVVAGLLDKLIERLADQNEQDSEYVSCFLLSHSFFIDSEDLLEQLIARFHIQPRQGEMLYFEQWQKVIQIKVLCVLYRWVQIQYEDFELNLNLLKTLKKFLEVDVRMNGFAKEAGYIEENISIRSLSPKKNCSVIMEQGRFCLQRSRTRKISLSRSQNRSLPPAGVPGLDPIRPSPTENVIEHGPTPELMIDSPILTLKALELARYLTLADMKAFRSITVFEIMSGWWKRCQAAENSKCTTDGDKRRSSGSGVNVVDVDYVEDGAIEAFTRRANMLSYWVAHEIVSVGSAKKRKSVIKHFIEVARLCGTLNNYHTCMFIVSALTSTPVRRLTQTWKLVSTKALETLRQLEKLLDPSGNMRHYRQVIAEAEAPTIPFFPILLKDITFILDGNPTMIASRINTSSNQTPPVSGSGGSNINNNSAHIFAAGVGAAGTKTTSESIDSAEGNKSNTDKNQLVNFDKFRQLTQYVEHAVDMAKSVDYWFEPQLLRQARVFRPTSPSVNSHGAAGDRNDGDSVHGSLQSGRGGNHGHISNSYNNPMDSSCGPLDRVSEIVEPRLVKASGLYGVHQRVIEVEFSTKPKSSTGSLWKGGASAVGGGGGAMSSLGGAIGYGGGGSSDSMHGSTVGGETVIRAVQGEEEYLMGLSLLCEPGR